MLPSNVLHSIRERLWYVFTMTKAWQNFEHFKISQIRTAIPMTCHWNSFCICKLYFKVTIITGLFIFILLIHHCVIPIGSVHKTVKTVLKNVQLRTFLKSHCDELNQVCSAPFQLLQRKSEVYSQFSTYYLKNISYSLCMT